jgi:dTDP-4-dehydrorhamnose reductase
MKKKKVLILGNQGNLGTQLMKVFQKDFDFETIGWDREDLNFLEFNKLEKAIEKERPAIIINATGYNNVDGCEEDEKELKLAYQLNRDLPKKLAEITSKLDSILIHYTSDYVFGGDEDKKTYQETDQPCPLQKYGETKYASEKEIARIKLKNSNFKYYLIRTSKLFGPKGENEIVKPSFFDIMLDLSKTKGELNVVNEEWSCFTYTPDLAQATKDLIEKNYNPGIYHLVNEGIASWYEAVLELFKIKNIEIKVNPVKGDQFPRPAQRPLYSALENTRFPKLRNYQEALKNYLEK